LSATPGISFAKISTLTVSQDPLLPNKIFEDESISPESDLDESKVGEKKAESQKDSTDSKEAPEKLETQGETQEKPKSLIPVHVIIKSRESSESPTMGRTKSTVISQLSPLSQPTDINTNTANATQHIRSIMSSINIPTKDNESEAAKDAKQEAENQINELLQSGTIKVSNLILT
jgi:histone-lysine N-methyltransferase MLL3